MKTAARLLLTMGCAMTVLVAVKAADQSQAGSLQAFCVSSTTTAKPGDAISIDCVLSNASVTPFILSSDGRWLGLSWTSNGKSGQSGSRAPFRNGASKSFIILRSGDVLRQKQTFWVPRDLDAGVLQVRASFYSKDSNDRFSYQCWTGTVTTAAISITVQKNDL